MEKFFISINLLLISSHHCTSLLSEVKERENFLFISLSLNDINAMAMVRWEEVIFEIQARTGLKLSHPLFLSRSFFPINCFTRKTLYYYEKSPLRQDDRERNWKWILKVFLSFSLSTGASTFGEATSQWELEWKTCNRLWNVFRISPHWTCLRTCTRSHTYRVNFLTLIFFSLARSSIVRRR